MAGDRARGSALYVTLEPCAHFGRTPPCAPRVAASGVRRVIAALVDPDPRVGGQGLELLRTAGVEVTVGVLRREAERQNRAFLTSVRPGRPHVTLKLAMTLDGKIADRHRVSQWITCAAAPRGGASPAQRGRCHSGRGGDGPGRRSRAHRPPGPAVAAEPYRVVLDSSARTSPDARIVQGPTPSRTVIMIADDAPRDRLERLQRAGAAVVRVGSRESARRSRRSHGGVAPARGSRPSVEGGAEVHGAFLASGLVRPDRGVRGASAARGARGPVRHRWIGSSAPGCAPTRRTSRSALSVRSARGRRRDAGEA